MWKNDVVVEVLVSVLFSEEETHFSLFSFRYGPRFGCFCTGRFGFLFSSALFKFETHPLLFLFWIRDTLFGCSRLNRVDFLWAKRAACFDRCTSTYWLWSCRQILFLGQWHSHFTLTFGIYLKQSDRIKILEKRYMSHLSSVLPFSPQIYITPPVVLQSEISH